MKMVDGGDWMRGMQGEAVIDWLLISENVHFFIINRTLNI